LIANLKKESRLSRPFASLGFICISDRPRHPLP
jgi:hypothetical protein